MFIDDWRTLGVSLSATEKEIRRAYATKLKQIDTAQDPAGFETLRQAYESALAYARYSTPPAPVELANDILEPRLEYTRTDAGAGAPIIPALAEPDRSAPFRALQSLIDNDDYSVAAWQRLLNDPLLDSPEVRAWFEQSLVQALTDHDTDFILCASPEWRELIESRYGWVADGLRYARRFPRHDDLRKTLVALRKPKIKARNRFVWKDLFHSGRNVGVVLFFLYLLLQLLTRLKT